MNKKRRAVLIGCGAIAPVHAQALAECEGVELAGVCDVVCERAERLAQQYHCAVYDNYEQVVQDAQVDVVHLCTPHYLHAPMAKQAAQCGKHLVIEKPFAMNRNEAETLQKELAKYPVQVCCILQNRYTPCIQKMKELIDNGTYGKVLGGRGILTWQRTAEYYNQDAWRGRMDTEGGGLLINQAIHLLDLLTFLGGACDKVAGTVANRTLQGVIEVEDTAEATLYTKADTYLHFFATNGYCTNSPFELELMLEKATLRFRNEMLYLCYDGAEEVLASNQSPEIGKAYWGSGHQRLLQRFYDALQGKQAAYTGVAEGVAAVRLVDGIYQSAQTGSAITI